MVFTSTIENGIAEMVFNHPPVNAFDSKGWFSIAKHINELGRDNSVNVIVIRAEGKGFCAGVDIKELAADGTKIVDVKTIFFPRNSKSSKTLRGTQARKSRGRYTFQDRQRHGWR